MPWIADDPKDDMWSELFVASYHQKELETVMIHKSRLNVFDSVEWVNIASGSDLTPSFFP